MHSVQHSIAAFEGLHEKFFFILIPTILLLFTLTDAMAARYKIGVFFWHESSNDYISFEGVEEGFKTAGVECEFDIQKAEGDEGKANKIVHEFNRKKLDLIYAMGTGAVKRLMKVITDTPIVFTAVTTPVQSGVTPNWQTSRRNLAGNSNWIDTEIILREFKIIVPSLQRLGVIYDPDNAVSSAEFSVARKIANKMKLEIEAVTIKSADDLIPASKLLLDKKVEAIWVPIDIIVYKNIDRIKSVADPLKIPLLSSSHRGIKDGAIFGMVVDYHALGKRSVFIALRILEQNMSPADIPIEKMHSFKRIVNLKSARELGYDVPLSVLATVDQIIK